MSPAPTNGRRAILDLAPLELECLRALWPLGAATVREVRRQMAPRLPRAYTTVMTILDRLAQKGIVAREKQGRAWLYRPLLSAQEARADAVGQVVEHYFDGSADALAAHLAGEPSPLPRPAGASASAGGAPAARAAAAAAASRGATAPGGGESPRTARRRRAAAESAADASPDSAGSDSAAEAPASSPALDTTLL